MRRRRANGRTRTRKAVRGELARSLPLHERPLEEYRPEQAMLLEKLVRDAEGELRLVLSGGLTVVDETGVEVLLPRAVLIVPGLRVEVSAGARALGRALTVKEVFDRYMADSIEARKTAAG